MDEMVRMAGFLGTCAAVVGGCYALVWYLRSKRTSNLAVVAAELNFGFEPRGELAHELTDFVIFMRGRLRQFLNCLVGESDEMLVRIFDFTYVIGHGKQQRRDSFTCLLLSSDKLDLPSFSLRPKGLLDRVGSVFGATTIEFEDDPEFSKAFAIEGVHQGAILRMFADEELRDLLLANRGYSIEGCGDRLVVYRDRYDVKPAMIRSFLTDGFRLFQGLADRSRLPEMVEA